MTKLMKKMLVSKKDRTKKASSKFALSSAVDTEGWGV